MPCCRFAVLLGLFLLASPVHAGGDGQAEQGAFEVPMSRLSEDSDPIRLRYVRWPATGTNPGPPIVYLAGGPGGSGIDGLRGNRAEFFQSLRKFGDVIGFDQRGTGSSEPEARTCPQSAVLPLDQPGAPDVWIESLRAGLEECVDSLGKLGTDASGFTTIESADDLEALRQALGAEQLTLLGSSYGTHLALAMARRHPESVARMVLAGVEGPDHTLKLPGAVQANLERVAAAIQRDPAYRESLPDPLATLNSLLEKLEHAPAAVTILPELEVTVGRWDLQAFLSEGMGSRDELERLPGRLLTMSRGDFSELARWARDRRSLGPIQLMSTAMDCASYASTARLERIRREIPRTLLGAAIDYPMPGICRIEGLPRLDAEFRAPLESPIPTLFISGTLDGRTPISNAEEIAAGFTHGRHLVLGNVSHGADLLIASPMIREVVHAFLADEDLPTTRIDLPGLAFEPAYRRSLAAEVVERLESEGFEETAVWLQEVNRRYAGGDVYDLGEGVLNVLGYDLLAADQVERAIAVFRLNVIMHPDAFNPWDSLGEAYMIAGERERAIESYEKSLELNSANDNARRMLERLRND